MRIAKQGVLLYISVTTHTNGLKVSNCWFNAVITFVYIRFGGLAKRVSYANANLFLLWNCVASRLKRHSAVTTL